jgi:hypothetical protein
LVRTSAIVPIIGYFILLNEKLLQYGTLWAGLSDISWRLLCLYFGLSLVGLAAIIYNFRRHNLIKSYGTAVEYALAEERYFIAGNNFEYARQSVLGWFDKAPEWQKRIRGLDDPDLHKPDLRREDQIITLMSARWHLRNTDRLAWRIAAGCLYAIGFLIVLVPTLVTFYEITVIAARMAVGAISSDAASLLG